MKHLTIHMIIYAKKCYIGSSSLQEAGLFKWSRSYMQTIVVLNRPLCNILIGWIIHMIHIVWKIICSNGRSSLKGPDYQSNPNILQTNCHIGSYSLQQALISKWSGLDANNCRTGLSSLQLTWPSYNPDHHLQTRIVTLRRSSFTIGWPIIGIFCNSNILLTLRCFLRRWQTVCPRLTISIPPCLCTTPTVCVDIYKTLYLLWRK